MAKNKKKSPSPPKHPCPKCQHEMEAREIHVIEDECWKCFSPMKIAFGFTEGLAHAPDDFSPEELIAARNAGVKLEVAHSRTMDSSYMANICPHCSALTGRFYLHEFWHLATNQTKVIETRECSACKDARAV
jgi:hypothetical protein